jgi:hypothetical protein
MKKKLEYKSGYKYQLATGVSYGMPKEFRKLEVRIRSKTNVTWVKLQNGNLFIREGYAWDGASGPTIDTKNSMRGSLVHDALYQMIEEELLPRRMRDDADDVFYDILRADGMSWIRAKVWYRMVRGFGRAKTPRMIETAP